MATPPAVTPPQHETPVPSSHGGLHVPKVGKLSYMDFVWFLLSEEDKKTLARWVCPICVPLWSM